MSEPGDVRDSHSEDASAALVVVDASAIDDAVVRRRGCRVIHLASFTFQAPGFYARHGFEQFARLEDLPSGHTNVFMLKRLAT